MMVEIPFHIVDVFAEAPFGGHPLVVVDPAADSLLTELSHEFNLVVVSPTPTGPTSYRVRIVEHGHELPFGGQPSLGAAWSLGPGKWTQESAGAKVAVESTANGATMEMPDPFLEPLSAEVDVARAMRLAEVSHVMRATCGGNSHLLAVVDTDVREARPDRRAIVEMSTRAKVNTVALLARCGGDIRMRVFAPAMGIDESPAVGTAAAPAALLARTLWNMAEDIAVFQGESIGRPSVLRVHAVPQAMRLSGTVRMFAKGTCWLRTTTENFLGSNCDQE